MIASEKKIVWLLLLLALWPFLESRGAEPDSVLIRTFAAGAYKASSLNYTGLEHPNGLVYFANENGVLEYDGSQWKLIPLKNFSAATSLALVGDKIYVGGRDEFGYLVRDSLGQYHYHSLRHLLVLNEGADLKDIWQIVPHDGDIYFGSLEMILRYDGKHVHSIPLKNSYIFKIEEQLFTSAFKEGLAKIDKNNLTVVNAEFSFPKDAAFHHQKGLKGENLLITADHGVFELDLSTYKTKIWKPAINGRLAKSSLYDTEIWQDSLYAFASYMEGLYLLDKNGNVVEVYNKDNGLYGNGLREMFKDKRGNLWLTSDFGLRYLQPWNQSIGLYQLNTLIRSVSIDDQTIPVAGVNTSLKTKPDYSGSVVFHYATPGFHSEELEYSYYLEGYETNWSAWKSEVKKEYTNLSGGDYTFHVKARYRKELESIPASLQLLVPTPWYKTKAAYFLWVVLFAAVLASTIHYRTKKLRLLNQRLAKIISKRTKELVEQREQLRATNNELRVRNTELDNFVYRSSHDLVAPLKSLKGLIHIAKNEKNDDNRDTYFRLMHTSVEKLEDFIKSIMEYSSNSKKDLIRTQIDLNEILESIVQDLKYYDKAERIELIRSINITTTFFSDPKRLKIVLSNLITNCIKYHNSYQDYLFIEVKAEQTDEHVKISVIDNGRGIEKEYLDRIFDMFFRASDSAQGSGLGLYIVKDTVEKLGGRISVTSDFGKGTTFTLLFPCNIPIETPLENTQLPA